MATARMSLYKPVYLDQRISLTPTELRQAATDIDAFLLEKIRKGLEGQCCTHGFVRARSTQILARSMGQAEHGRFTGDFLYYCKIKVDCFLPHENQVLEGRILKANKLGCYALIFDRARNRTLEAMRILLPRDLHLGNLEFNAIQAGQTVRLRILRSRFQANDAFIQGVGLFEAVTETPEPVAAAVAGEEEELPKLEPAVAATEFPAAVAAAPAEVAESPAAVAAAPAEVAESPAAVAAAPAEVAAA